jgi:redox-regulated HSP33 family molecular chaperone
MSIDESLHKPAKNVAASMRTCSTLMTTKLMVSEIWTKERKGNSPMQRWQNKIRRLRQFLRGWAKNMNGAYKKEKQELLRKAEELGKKAEFELLSQQEWDLKQSVHVRLTQLLRV